MKSYNLYLSVQRRARNDKWTGRRRFVDRVLAQNEDCTVAYKCNIIDVVFIKQRGEAFNEQHENNNGDNPVYVRAFANPRSFKRMFILRWY